MVTDSGTYRQADDKDRSTSWATHDPTRRDLIFAPPAFFLFFCRSFAKSKELQPYTQADTVAAHLLLPQRTWQQWAVTFLKVILFAFLFFATTASIFAQTNPKHVKVSGYYRKDGTYVQPYFRTAPNSTNRDNFSTKGNTNPYTGKPGWIEPDNKYNTFYYSTYIYSTNKKQTDYTTSTTTLPIQYKNRTYIEDEHGR